MQSGCARLARAYCCITGVSWGDAARAMGGSVEVGTSASCKLRRSDRPLRCADRLQLADVPDSAPRRSRDNLGFSPASMGRMNHQAEVKTMRMSRMLAAVAVATVLGSGAVQAGDDAKPARMDPDAGLLKAGEARSFSITYKANVKDIPVGTKRLRI